MFLDSQHSPMVLLKANYAGNMQHHVAVLKKSKPRIKNT